MLRIEQIHPELVKIMIHIATFHKFEALLLLLSTKYIKFLSDLTLMWFFEYLCYRLNFRKSIAGLGIDPSDQLSLSF
jgi:hypothetical protein